MSTPVPSSDEIAAEEILAGAGYPPSIIKTLRCGPRPSLGGLRPIKQLLEKQLGPEAAANAYTRMAGNVPGEIATLPIGSLHDYARMHAQHYQEISAPRSVLMPPVRVFGDDTRRGFQARSRSVYCCVLVDAVVSSKSNFILAGGRALLDYQDGELEMVPLDLGVDPIIFAPTDDCVTVVIEQGGTTATTIDEAFTLVGVNSFNYWHWHIEFLPRLMACLYHPDFQGVPILVDAQMPAQSIQALRHFVGDERRIHVLQPGEAVRVGRLWTCSMFMYLPLWPKPGTTYAPRTMFMDTRSFVAQLLRAQPLPDSIDSPEGSRRVYLGRHPSQHRGMENHSEVEAWFAAHGFEMVDLGMLAFADQLAVVRSAHLIVGPNGAALVNSLFARPGTRIGILDNHFIEDNEWYADVCHALGQRLTFLVGEVVNVDTQYEFNANYRIPMDSLPAFLDHLLSDDDAA